MPSQRDILAVDRDELRDRISLRIDRELIDAVDHRRASLSRSQYVERVLAAALQRDHPHLPDDWTPERQAEQLAARLRRYLATGR